MLYSLLFLPSIKDKSCSRALDGLPDFASGRHVTTFSLDDQLCTLCNTNSYWNKTYSTVVGNVFVHLWNSNWTPDIFLHFPYYTILLFTILPNRPFFHFCNVPQQQILCIQYIQLLLFLFFFLGYEIRVLKN